MEEKDILKSKAYQILYKRYFSKWESGEISTKEELKAAIEADIENMKNGIDPDVKLRQKHKPRSKGFLNGKK